MRVNSHAANIFMEKSVVLVAIKNGGFDCYFKTAVRLLMFYLISS